MKEELCAAFCDGLRIASVPAGLAVGTAFQRTDGDSIEFYIIGPDEAGMYIVQDDGSNIPYLEACGADLSIPARELALAEILEEHAVALDSDTLEIKSGKVHRSQVAKASLRLVAALLRVQDLLLMTRERVERTWVQEVKKDLEKKAAEFHFSIEYDAPVNSDLTDYPADAMLRSHGRAPVALFWGTSDTKIYEALLLQSSARYEARTEVQVVVMLENDNSVTRKARARADNHVIVPRYREGTRDAIGRVVEAATGSRPSVVH
jgi:hypothetical protein